MPSLSWMHPRTNRPVVASLLALPAEEERSRSQFAVMVSHLYDRLLNNEVFGDDSAARVAELSYAIALPGVLVALFLFPAYHGLPPHPIERSFISQACDHLFFVTYAFVVMGCAMIFQWEMLFPDAVDVSVMTTLPISLRRLLTGRITAVAMFLALVHVGTSGLGCLFLPAVADQRCGFFRQLLAQGTAVSMAGVCIVAALVALQAMLLWMPRGYPAEMVRSGIRVALLSCLMTILFLFPLTAHSLGQLLGGGGAAEPGIVHWLPTFWFLGVYDSIMWGDHAPLVFHTLARTGVLVTLTCLLLATVTYPLGYRRRVQLLVEGAPLRKRQPGLGLLSSMLHRTVFQTPGTRATAYLAAQTLSHNDRLHLYLAMYVGLGAALVLSSVFALRIDGSQVALVFQQDGLLITVPLVAFWAVAGLHTALRSPVGRRGSWVFQAIGGNPGKDELSGGRRLTMCVAWVATGCTVLLLDAFAPKGIPGPRELVTQLLFACGLPFFLTEGFFANVRAVPFTGAARHAVYTLPFAFVRYFVVLPAFALCLTAAERRATGTTGKIVVAAVLLGVACVCSRFFRKWFSSRASPTQELTLVVLHED